jgi:hypothetical protein
MKNVCEKLSLPLINMPHINTTKHGSYKKYYDQETRDVIARQFESDIMIGNYSF